MPTPLICASARSASDGVTFSSPATDARSARAGALRSWAARMSVPLLRSTVFPTGWRSAS